MNALSGFLWGIIFSLPVIVPVPGQAELVTQGYLFWGPISALFLLMSVLVLFKVNIDPDFKALEAKYQESQPELES